MEGETTTEYRGYLLLPVVPLLSPLGPSFWLVYDQDGVLIGERKDQDKAQELVDRCLARRELNGDGDGS